MPAEWSLIDDEPQRDKLSDQDITDLKTTTKISNSNPSRILGDDKKVTEKSNEERKIETKPREKNPSQKLKKDN